MLKFHFYFFGQKQGHVGISLRVYVKGMLANFLMESKKQWSLNDKINQISQINLDIKC